MISVTLFGFSQCHFVSKRNKTSLFQKQFLLQATFIQTISRRCYISLIFLSKCNFEVFGTSRHVNYSTKFYMLPDSASLRRSAVALDRPLVCPSCILELFRHIMGVEAARKWKECGGFEEFVIACQNNCYIKSKWTISHVTFSRIY